VLDEAKMSVYDWDRRDEEYINVTKYDIVFFLGASFVFAA
jgi:hypothetical protein